MKEETEQFEQMAATLTVFKIKAEWLFFCLGFSYTFLRTTIMCLYTMQIIKGTAAIPAFIYEKFLVSLPSSSESIFKGQTTLSVNLAYTIPIIICSRLLNNETPPRYYKNGK